MTIRWCLVLIAIAVYNNISSFLTPFPIIHGFWKLLVVVLDSSVFFSFKSFNPEFLKNKCFNLRFENVKLSLWRIWRKGQPYLALVKLKSFQKKKKQQNTWFTLTWPSSNANRIDGMNTRSVADANATC